MRGLRGDAYTRLYIDHPNYVSDSRSVSSPSSIPTSTHLIYSHLSRASPTFPMDDLTAFTEPEFLATQEHLSRYRTDGRGYLPVELGDLLGEGRYVLRHKLGFGGFGVVWLGWELGLV